MGQTQVAKTFGGTNIKSDIQWDKHWMGQTGSEKTMSQTNIEWDKHQVKQTLSGTNIEGNKKFSGTNIK